MKEAAKTIGKAVYHAGLTAVKGYGVVLVGLVWNELNTAIREDYGKKCDDLKKQWAAQQQQSNSDISNLTLRSVINGGNIITAHSTAARWFALNALTLSQYRNLLMECSLRDRCDVIEKMQIIVGGLSLLGGYKLLSSTYNQARHFTFHATKFNTGLHNWFSSFPHHNTRIFGGMWDLLWSPWTAMKASFNAVGEAYKACAEQGVGPATGKLLCAAFDSVTLSPHTKIKNGVVGLCSLFGHFDPKKTPVKLK